MNQLDRALSQSVALAIVFAGGEAPFSWRRGWSQASAPLHDLRRLSDWLTLGWNVYPKLWDGSLFGERLAALTSHRTDPAAREMAQPIAARPRWSTVAQVQGQAQRDTSAAERRAKRRRSTGLAQWLAPAKRRSPPPAMPLARRLDEAALRRAMNAADGWTSPDQWQGQGLIATVAQADSVALPVGDEAARQAQWLRRLAQRAGDGLKRGAVDQPNGEQAAASSEADVNEALAQAWTQPLVLGTEETVAWQLQASQPAQGVDSKQLKTEPRPASPAPYLSRRANTALGDDDTIPTGAFDRVTQNVDTEESVDGETAPAIEYKPLPSLGRQLATAELLARLAGQATAGQGNANPHAPLPDNRPGQSSSAHQLHPLSPPTVARREGELIGEAGEGEQTRLAPMPSARSLDWFGAAEPANVIAPPSRTTTLPALQPPQRLYELPLPVASAGAAQSGPPANLIGDGEDLDALAVKIKRILDEEARRHGIAV